MRLSFVPVFCTVGVKFVIDHRALRWLRHEVEVLLRPSPGFLLRYGDSCEFLVYLDGDNTINEPRVLGPRFLKKACEIELRIIVPLSSSVVDSYEEVSAIIRTILLILVAQLKKCEVDSLELALKVDSIVDRFVQREWLQSVS